MRTTLIARNIMIPVAGCLLTSCETSGQLLPGGVCACVTTLALGIVLLSCRNRRHIVSA